MPLTLIAGYTMKTATRMVISQKNGAPNIDPKILHPYYEAIQNGTPNFGKPPNDSRQRQPPVAHEELAFLAVLAGPPSLCQNHYAVLPAAGGSQNYGPLLATEYITAPKI